MAEPIGTRTLRELTRIIFTRLGVVVIIVALITVGALAVCLSAEKHYRSSVTFLVKEPKPRNPTAQQVSPDRSLQVFIKTQHELITSETVLARTFAMLVENNEQGVKEEAKAWRNARQAWLSDSSEKNWGAFLASLRALDARIEEIKDGTKDKERAERFRNGLRRFAGRIDVETPGGTDVALSEVFILEVTQPGPPINAQHAADCLAKCYMDRYREVQAHSSRQAVEFMRGRLASLKKERLQKAEQAIRDFVDELESPADLVILEQLTRSGSEAGRQITVRRFNEEIISIEGSLAEARQQKQQLLEQLPKGLWKPGTERDENGELIVPDLARVSEEQLPDESPILTGIVTIIPEATLRNNVIVSQLKSKEVSLIIELNRLKVEYNDDYRGVRDKLTEIARTRRQILMELIGESGSQDIKIATLTARKNELQRKRDQELIRLNDITEQLVRYQDLQQEMLLARTEYNKIAGDLASALTFQGQEADAITINIVDEAKLPDVARPAYPRTGLYTLVAVVVGMLLAVAYAFLADHFNHTLVSIEDTEHYLGIPVVGSIEKCSTGLLR